MAYDKAPRISTDRFDNAYQLKFAIQQTDKKTGEFVNSYKTYFELNKKLYKIEVSHTDKTKEIKGVEYNGQWVKVTATNPKRTHSSM